ncbi:HWE histidine kinase domain-containing protein [Parablastomonas sp. CN1-191]|uniref:HWE histidine kinase domain-containing protein n=1 Tax=Parablastomonas sp. CN1-191 TaxID=3400908 RepID=UPI003BF8D1C2
MSESPYPGEVDLDTCAREPIHIIGRIQSFGYLISFASDWIVNHASANCEALTRRPAADLIGRPATDFLTGSALHDLRSRLQLIAGSDSVERMFDIDLMGDGRLFDVGLHKSARSFVLEAEPSESGRRRDYVAFVRPMIDRMRKADSVEGLCAAAARQMRALTGFDRVMVYRFEPSGAGEVVAESTAGDHGSYMGMHFPASDIPAQARALYARNLLRIISDVDDPTVPVIPAVNPDGDPLDLSMSGLRAVSPIHIEYLRNMGVGASMSVSIMRRGKLWGLIACHHYGPLKLAYSLRTACELFGEFFAYLLEQVDVDAAEERRTRATRMHDEIMARIASGSTLLSAFDDFTETIARVIPYDGIVGWVDGEFVSRGEVPTRERFIELARFLNTTGTSTVWATDKLSATFAPAADYTDCCSGILALPVSRNPRDYIVLFRKEWLHEVNWAGNPQKPAEFGPHGMRLHPRKSFEIWTEERSGQSRPWLPDEITVAENLRITLLEVVLRLADAASRERERASARQDMLIAELNHRVRNILNLIRGLVAQSRDSADTIDGYAEIIGDRIYALARAHDLMTQTSWEPSSLHALVRAEAAAYVGDNIDTVAIAGPDAMIEPTAFTPLALVIHELMTNSVKYGALSVPEGTVDLTVEAAPSRQLTVTWRERGGPEVQPPQRRGLGSIIIERNIPHDLGGEAAIEFRKDGVVARFVIPAAHVAEVVTGQNVQAVTAPPSEPIGADIQIDGEVLVVEDNMIIAMEAEDLLGELGASRCHVANSVRKGLELLDLHPISFALLDINLGAETSEPVARTLLERGIPFIFASGYGDSLNLASGFADVPVVTKPFSLKDIRAGIARRLAR